MKYFCFVIFIFVFCNFSLFQTTDEPLYLPKKFLNTHINFSYHQQKNLLEVLDSIKKQYPSVAIKWWVIYKKALFLQKNTKLFCNDMQFLSTIQNFPLKDYARLNTYSHCSKDIEINISDFPQWLHKKAILQWYKKAKIANHPTELMNASYSMYQISTQKYLREKYLFIALKIAKQINIQLYTQWKNQLLILSPRFIENPTHEQHFMVANDFKQARNFKKAILYYRKLLNNPLTSFVEKNKSFKKISWIYKIQKKNKRYLRATVQWKTWLKKNIKTNIKAQKIYSNIFYKIARTQWTLNQATNALNTLKQIEKEQITKNFSLFTTYRLKASILYEQRKIKKAIYFFKKALQQTPPDIETSEQTQWSYAWALKKYGRPKESINILKKLLHNSKSEYLPSRILFWIGRTYEDIKEPQKAQSAYKTLIKKNPLSYYGFLAHYKLNQEIHLPQDKKLFPIQNDEDYIVVQWLLSVNQYKEAINILQYRAKQYKQNKSTNTKKWSTLFYYMAKAGTYFPLFKMVGQLPQKERTIFFTSYTELMFPILYKREIDNATRLFKIEKEFIYSLIRQESAWNYKAKSIADAFGLTQIRPFVAKKVAKKINLPYKNVYDLYDPQKNILLGTAFLRQIMTQYKNQFIIAMATYNAGRTAVQHWKKRLPLNDPISFIEEIPYEETRTYIRLLMRNFIFYKLLTTPSKKIYFPKKLLFLSPL